MKKHLIFKVGLILVLLGMLFTVCACDSTDNGTTDTTETEAPKDPAIYIIVRSDSGNKEETDGAVRLRKYIRETLGIEIDLETDWIKRGENVEDHRFAHEIIFGDTNRNESIAAYNALNVGTSDLVDYSLASAGDHYVIAASSGNVDDAVTQFISYLEANPDMLYTAPIAMDDVRVHDFPLDDITVFGESITTFDAIVYPLSYNQQLIADVQQTVRRTCDLDALRTVPHDLLHRLQHALRLRHGEGHKRPLAHRLRKAHPRPQVVGGFALQPEHRFRAMQHGICPAPRFCGDLHAALQRHLRAGRQEALLPLKLRTGHGAFDIRHLHLFRQAAYLHPHVGRAVPVGRNLHRRNKRAAHLLDGHVPREAAAAGLIAADLHPQQVLTPLHVMHERSKGTAARMLAQERAVQPGAASPRHPAEHEPQRARAGNGLFIHDRARIVLQTRHILPEPRRHAPRLHRRSDFPDRRRPRHLAQPVGGDVTHRDSFLGEMREAAF